MELAQHPDPDGLSKALGSLQLTAREMLLSPAITQDVDYGSHDAIHQNARETVATLTLQLSPVARPD
jgi:hypothetical protein